MPGSVSRWRRRSSIGTFVLLAVSLAACGSQIDPDTHRRANGQGAVMNTGSQSAGGTIQGPGGTSGAVSRGSGDGSGGRTSATTGPTTTSKTDLGSGSRTSGPQPGSCAGFQNQTGITDHTITIANVADITGPIPGAFQSAQDATRAYVAYFNATHPNGICGRTLKLLELDSHTDASGDQEAYARACEQAFAAVGSMSAFDSGGAGVTEKCGLPDLRSSSVNPARVACATCFAAQALQVDEVASAMPRYFAENFPAASQHASFLWIDAGAAPVNAKSFIKAWEKNGFKFVYTSSIDIAEFNFTPYVQKMKERGVRYVQLLGPYQDTVRLAQAMQQQGYKPDVFVQDSTIYDQDFVDSGDGDVEGIWTYLNITPFTHTENPEMATYLEWLNQVDPSSSPTFFGVFAWSAAQLFVEQSLALGGKLTRESLLASLSDVDGWTGNGIHAPQHVGSKSTGECWRMFQLHDGEWINESGAKYICDPITHT